MKRTVIGLIVGVLIVCALGANYDRREQSLRYPIAKYQFAQLEWASGESGALTATISNVNMLIERIDIIVSDSTNAITYTVTIADENTVSSAELYSDATIPENAQTVHLATKATPDFDAFPCSGNTLTATVTPSGDPGASGATVDIPIYGP